MWPPKLPTRARPRLRSITSSHADSATCAVAEVSRRAVLLTFLGLEERQSRHAGQQPSIALTQAGSSVKVAPHRVPRAPRHLRRGRNGAGVKRAGARLC